VLQNGHYPIPKWRIQCRRVLDNNRQLQTDTIMIKTGQWSDYKIQRKRSIMFALILVMICILGATAGQILMKMGIGQIDSIANVKSLLNIVTLTKIFTNPYIILGLLSYGVSAILWLGAMSSLNVSFMYPLLSLAYVLTAVAAWLFLKESLSFVHWVGIILIVSGCAFITSTRFQ